MDGEWQEVPWLVPILPVFPKVKTIFADKVRQEPFVRQSNLDWIIVRPARLTNGPRRGSYKIGAPIYMGITSKIARPGVADFILKPVSDNTYGRQVPRLRY